MYPGLELKRSANPREGTNLLSLLTYWFTLPIFAKSAARDLQEDDIYDVLADTQASHLGNVAEKEWKHEGARNHPSLTKLLLRCFGVEYLSYGLVYCAVCAFEMLVEPLAIGKLVEYFSAGSKQTLWEVTFYSFLMVLTSTVTATAFQYYYLALAHLGLRIKVSLCSLMYRKALRLGTASLGEFTNGRVVTMMSKDVNIFDSVLSYGHDVWVGVVLLAIMSVIMFREIQWAAVVGIGFFLVLLPIYTYLGILSKNLRIKAASKTDARLRRIQEVLTFIKLIKYYTWDKYFTKITAVLRSNELRTLRKVYYLKAGLIGMGGPIFRTSLFICIFSYSYLGEVITAEKAFVAVACYRVLERVFCGTLAQSVTQFAEAKSSLKRIKEFLLVKEVEAPLKPVTRGEISCDKRGFRAVVPELVGITGGVGGGKSSFFRELIEGGTGAGELSYASQEPWVFPATIRQNILFGQQYEPKRYHEVLRVCGLAKDLVNFPDGDHTIAGLNLSRGQQARVNLARAVYKDAQVYLLDDALSSLDAKVGAHVFSECIKRFLAGKLVLLVCNNTMFLEQTDRVVVFDGGTATDKVPEQKLKSYCDISSNVPVGTGGEDAPLLQKVPGVGAVRVYTETKQEGNVNWRLYKRYFDYIGGTFYFIVVCLLCLLAIGLGVYFDFYLTIWVEAEEKVAAAHRNLTLDPDDENLTRIYTQELAERDKTMTMYLVIVIICVFSIACEFSVFTVGLRVSRRLHEKVFRKVMGASMEFFDGNLSGNVLNRFAKDFAVIDELLPSSYMGLIMGFFALILELVAIVQTKFVFVLPSCVLLAVFWYSVGFYLKASRSLKRLEGTTRAPVIGYLNSSLEGLTTITAAGNQQALTSQFDRHQDLNSSAMYMFASCVRALAFWLNIICNLFQLAIIAGFVYFQDRLESYAGDVGFALTQSFGLARAMQGAVQSWAEVENYMTSVERVAEYESAEQERGGGCAPVAWPSEGVVEFKDVNLSYPSLGGLQLRDVSFRIGPREKIGVVGRTGAGKSSLVSALFALYPFEGAVLLDRVDVGTVDLQVLRSRISIIPQQPVVFEGTVRTNLDALGVHRDAALWRALAQVGLKSVVEGLDSPVAGGSFSQGQRQLFSLARAILNENRVLVLDEATANVDPQTADTIHGTVTKLFEDCTVITIAHRLATIMGCDRVIVVDDGRVVEMDAPSVLLGKKDGIFYSLAKQSGLAD